jgi:hypothetical protein
MRASGRPKRGRRILAVGVAVAIPVLGVAVQTSCQTTPTQILVTVVADSGQTCLQIQDTIVYAASTERGLASGEQASQNGCSAIPRIGTVVLLPADESVSDVVVRVVTGAGKPAKECVLPYDELCIVAKQRVRFVKGEVVSMQITVGSKCLGISCGVDATCDPATGACIDITCANPPCDKVDEDVGPIPGDTDGGSSGGTSGTSGGTSGGIVDTGPIDTGPERCNAKCAGTCDAQGRCVLTCGNGQRCSSGCQANQPCVVNCNGNNACVNFSCGQASSCEIHCQGGSQPPCSGTYGCGSTTGDCKIFCESPSGCGGPMLCSTAPDAGSTCSVACTPASCTEQTVKCCGTPEAGCNVQEPPFKKEVTTSCP